MKKIVLSCLAITASMAVLLVAGTSAVAQSGNHPADVKTIVKSYPADIQNGYRVFATKCSGCHGLSSSLSQSRSSEGWADEVHRMQAMASSHINNRESEEILKFLRYDETHRKAAARETIGASSNGSPEVIGKQLFDSYGCSSCHSVAGVGNTASALDGIGNKKTAAELKQLITSPASGSTMPAMSISSDKDLNNLVTYLLSVKGQ